MPLVISGPQHRAPLSRDLLDVGAWRKTARDGDREYPSVKLDDPSFPAPIYASPVKVEDDEGFTRSGRVATATDLSRSWAPPPQRRGFLVLLGPLWKETEEHFPLKKLLRVPPSRGQG